MQRNGFKHFHIWVSVIFSLITKHRNIFIAHRMIEKRITDLQSKSNAKKNHWKKQKSIHEDKQGIIQKKGT